jgi:ABC-2 type transport system permease protein
MTAPPLACPDRRSPTPAGVAIRYWWRPVAVIAHREILRQLKQPVTIFTQVAQLGFFLVVYGIGFASMIGSAAGVPFAAYVLPGILAINAVTTGTGAGLSFAFDRDYGFMREMFIAPVPRLAIPLGKALGVTVQAVAYSALLLVAAPALGVTLSPARVGATLAGCALTTAVFCALGLALATLITKVQVLQGVIQLAMFPLLCLSGSVFSPKQAPAWLDAAIRANPMTYAVDLLRHTLLQAPPAAALLRPAGVDLTVLAALGLLFFAAIRARIGR